MFSNLGVKIGALVVALLLWLHVVTEKTYTHTFQLSIHPVQLDKDLIVAEKLPPHLQAKISGKGKHLLSLMFSDIKINLDLHDAIQKKTRYDLKLSDVVIPRDLDMTVLEILEPDYVDVDIDRFMTKEVHIRPLVFVNAAYGYVVVGNVSLSPDSTALSGPKRHVEQIDTLVTQTVTVERAKQSVVRELFIIPPQGTNVAIKPHTTVAEVEVQKLKQRLIKDIPVTIINAPAKAGINLDISTIALTVEGGAGIVDSLTTDDFRVSVDYRLALRDSSRVIAPAIHTPANITWIGAEPPIFHILQPES